MRPVRAPDATLSFEERIAGCYALEPGPWQTDSILAIPSAPFFAPTRFRLEVTRLPGWDLPTSDTLPLYVARSYPEARQDSTMFTSWRRMRVGSDTIRISDPLPLAGVGLLVAPDGRDLAGQIYTFTDVVSEGGLGYAHAPIRARRILCPRL